MPDEYDLRLQKLGMAFRRRREELGFSQRGLAATSKLHHNYISGIERGERNPTMVTLWKLCEALEVDFIDIVKSIK